MEIYSDLVVLKSNFINQAQHQKKKAKKIGGPSVLDANNNYVKNVKNKNYGSFSEGIASINDAINPQDITNQSSMEEIDKFSQISRNSEAKMTSVIECGTYE